MIKAIETRWKGYRFRSRLEARWAVFFEEIGLEWEYEPQGYHTSKGPYLPDFFLPGVLGGLWVEIKPKNGGSGDDDVAKLCDVVEKTNTHATLFKGDPYDVCGSDIYDRPGVGDWSANMIIFVGDQGAGVYDCPYCFCVCPMCGKVGFEFDGRGARICGGECQTKPPIDDFQYRSIGHSDKGYSEDHPRILNAALAARSARFEHGEKPKIHNA